MPKSHVTSSDHPPASQHASSSHRLRTYLAIAAVTVVFFWTSANQMALQLEHFSPSRMTQQVASHPIDSALSHQVHNPSTTAAEQKEQKALIVASQAKDDTMWVHENFPDWQRNVYVVDDHAANNTVLMQGGNEAVVYLTYLINHYAELPSIMVFSHADRYQWHNDDPLYDGVMPIRNLQLDYVREIGYTSLRCNWWPTCPAGLTPTLHPNESHGLSGLMEMDFAFAWPEMFPDTPMPELVGAPCCAQFALSREQALATPVWQLERLREFLWHNDIGRHRAGLVMEFMYHILFGKPADNCPSAEICYCRVYGHCNLKCTEPGSCEGRFAQNPGSMGVPLPKGWPLNGQETGGWPAYGWWQKWYPNETWGLEYAAGGAVSSGEDDGIETDAKEAISDDA